MTRSTRRTGASAQSGITLIEVLIAVAIIGIIGVPLTSWLISTLGHQDAAQHHLRNAVGTGFLANHLTQDVASASRVLVHPGGGDCTGGGKGAGGDVVLSIVPSSAAGRIVYSEADSGGSSSLTSLWRRQCNAAGALTESFEVFKRIIPGSADLACVAADGAAGACDQPQFRTVQLHLTPCPTRPTGAAASCDPTGATPSRDIELQVKRRITPGFEDFAVLAPLAEISVSPRFGFLNTDFTFDASNSIAGPGATYEWSFPTDGGATASGQSVTRRFTSYGVHEVNLVVTEGGVSNEAVATIEVLSRPPIAVAAVTGEIPNVVFDGSGSSSPDGLALSYHWSFADDQTAEGMTVASPYVGAHGRRRAVLRVTDSAGNSATDAVMVDFGVEPPGPIGISPSPIPTPGKLPTVGSVGAGLDPLAVTFSSDDQGAGHTWTLSRVGGSDPVATSADASFVHTFGPADAGEYEVVRNGQFGIPVQDPVQFRVNAAPTANFNVSVAAFGSPTSFTGTATDSDGSVVTYQWNFGWAGWTGTGASPVHVYSNPGAYLVALTVTDDDGATAVTMRAVQIPGVPPAPAAPGWSGDTVTWAAVPGAEGYTIELWCSTGAPLPLTAAAGATSIDAPAGYCADGAATAALRVRANGVTGPRSPETPR